MKLTRRDAIVALTAMGIGAGEVGRAFHSSEGEDAIVRRMLAAAETVYPSTVDVNDEFVSTYVLGRLTHRENHRTELERAVTELNDHARRVTGRAFEDLAVDRRRDVFRDLGVDRALSNPDGTVEEQIRYYVVNDLLYVLFTSPVGGTLVGFENPPGYPGGRESYQRGP